MADLHVYTKIESCGRRQGYLTTYVSLTAPMEEGEALVNPSLEELAGAIERAGHRRVSLVLDESLWGGFDVGALVDLLNRRSALEMGQDSQKPETNAEVSTYEFNLLLLGPVDYRLDRVNCFATLSLGPGSFNLDLLGPAMDALGDEDALVFHVATREDLSFLSQALRTYRSMSPIFAVLGPGIPGIEFIDVMAFFEDNGLEEVCIQAPLN